jgi:peptidyl-prolyl cis-trans isomerase C
VAAKVDGYVIHLSDVQGARGLLPSQLQNQPMSVVYPVLLDSLINSHLTAQKARELGMDKTDEYKMRMARIGDQILERMLLSQVIEKQITNEQVKKRYDVLSANAKNAVEIHARHILLETEDAALLMVKRLKAGEDFATLAKQNSTGPSSSKGGDLGWFGPGDVLPEFEQAAMALEPGTFTEKPVKTKYGWHVIKVEERRPIVVPSFDEAREAIANELSARAGQDLMKKLRSKADVTQVDWRDLNPDSKK